MQLITQYTNTDTGEGGPLKYKGKGNQSQRQATAQKHTFMLAAGQSQKTGYTHTDGDDTIHTPLCMDILHTIN